METVNIAKEGDSAVNLLLHNEFIRMTSNSLITSFYMAHHGSMSKDFAEILSKATEQMNLLARMGLPLTVVLPVLEEILSPLKEKFCKDEDLLSRIAPLSKENIEKAMAEIFG